jgi:hypothetical protein
MQFVSEVTPVMFATWRTTAVGSRNYLRAAEAMLGGWD